MANLFEKLKRLLTQQRENRQTMDNRQQSTPSDIDTPKLTESALCDLMQQIEKTQEGMYTCEETYALLDEYVDMVSNNQDAEKLMPLVKAHLDACPGCREEYEILVDVMNGELSS